MKKITLIIVASIFFLAGCQKDKRCNCGEIVRMGITNTNCYYMVIKNSCSGNEKRFCYDEQIWSKYKVGEQKCVPLFETW